HRRRIGREIPPPALPRRPPSDRALSETCLLLPTLAKKALFPAPQIGIPAPAAHDAPPYNMARAYCRRSSTCCLFHISFILTSAIESPFSLTKTGLRSISATPSSSASITDTC